MNPGQHKTNSHPPRGLDGAGDPFSWTSPLRRRAGAPSQAHPTALVQGEPAGSPGLTPAWAKLERAAFRRKFAGTILILMGRAPRHTLANHEMNRTAEARPRPGTSFRAGHKSTPEHSCQNPLGEFRRRQTSPAPPDCSPRVAAPDSAGGRHARPGEKARGCMPESTHSCGGARSVRRAAHSHSWEASPAQAHPVHAESGSGLSSFGLRAQSSLRLGPPIGDKREQDTGAMGDGSSDSSPAQAQAHPGSSRPSARNRRTNFPTVNGLRSTCNRRGSVAIASSSGVL